MATITIELERGSGITQYCLRGIGKVIDWTYYSGHPECKLVVVIPQMSQTRFENVVKRVLTKHLEEQGITPISITYSE